MSIFEHCYREDQVTFSSRLIRFSCRCIIWAAVFFIFSGFWGVSKIYAACNPSASGGICGEIDVANIEELPDGRHNIPFVIRRCTAVTCSGTDVSVTNNDFEFDIVGVSGISKCNGSVDSGDNPIIAVYNGCDFRDAGIGRHRLELIWRRTAALQKTLDTAILQINKGPLVANKLWIQDMEEEGAGTGKFKIYIMPNEAGRATIRTYSLRILELYDPNDWGNWPNEYECDAYLNARGGFGWDTTCDFSRLPSGAYTLAMFDAGLALTSTRRVVSTFPFTTSNIARFVGTPVNTNDPNFPNKFKIGVETYAAAEAGDYSIKLVRRRNDDVVDDSCKGTFTPPETKDIECNFSFVDPRDSYDILLYSPDGTMHDRRQIRLTVPPRGSNLNGICVCEIESSARASSVCDNSVPMGVTLDQCAFGSVPDTECRVNSGASGAGPGAGSNLVCRCTCSSSLSVPPLIYSVEDFDDALGNIHKYLIALGVFSSILILPYIAVLWASGNPEDVKKGWEWLRSLLTGLILLLLSGTIIKLVGSDFLSLGI